MINNIKINKMKYTISSIFLIFAFISYGQDIILPLEGTHDIEDQDNYYYKDLNHSLDKYEGNWVYDNGTDFLQITFFIQERYDLMGDFGTIDVFYDILQSSFLYKKNGVTIYNTYPSADPNDKLLIVGNSIRPNNILSLVYTEPTDACYRHRNGSLNIQYIPSSTSGGMPSLNWIMTEEHSESILNSCGNGELPDTSEFQIPSNMVLVKQ
jgi:hypothetical protein